MLEDESGSQGMPIQSMTSDERISHIEERIRYWEGVRNDASSGDHLIEHKLRKDLGYGPRHGMKAIVEKCDKRIDTLRGEIARLEGRGTGG